MLETLVTLAQDLAAGVPADERHRRLVVAARTALGADAAALLRLDGDALVPVAVEGLRGEALARRFRQGDHPRLARILAAEQGVRFSDSGTPDPFDALLADDGGALAPVHACMGCRLVIDGEVVGALTVDARSPGSFDRVDPRALTGLASLAAASFALATRPGTSPAAAITGPVASRPPAAEELLGRTPALRRVQRDIALLTRCDLPVLILGESGVGKELVARAIHAGSRRRERPLIEVNCAALPEPLAESELFGHLRGAFTGAAEARAGKLEAAHGGTLFLDEVGELAPAVQAKLLRALQTGEVARVGADRPLRFDVRIIAATNRDLQADVAAGRFRRDLYHRLCVVPVHVPPLRDRRDDLPLLTGRLLDRARDRLGLGELRLTADARAALRAHSWPGNVRELEHTLLRAALRASESATDSLIVIGRQHLALDVGDDGDDGEAGAVAPGSLRAAVDQYTARVISATVAECGGNWAEAARRLGLHRANLHRLAARLGLRRGPSSSK